jgi:hypothetical protein
MYVRVCSHESLTSAKRNLLVDLASVLYVLSVAVVLSSYRSVRLNLVLVADFSSILLFGS